METTPSNPPTKQKATLRPRRGSVKAQIFQSIARKLFPAVTNDCQALVETKWSSSAAAAVNISTSTSAAAAGLPPRRGRVKAQIFESIAGKLSSAVTKDRQAPAKTKRGSSATAAVNISTSTTAAASPPPRRGRSKAQVSESIAGKLSSAVMKACQVLAKTKGYSSAAAVGNISTSTSAATSPPPSAYNSDGYPDEA